MANTTIVEAQETQKTAAIPQFVNPPTFNPRQDSTMAFIRAYDRCAIANGWDYAHKLIYFETFLDGVAQLWFKEYQTRHPDSTWDNVVEAFHNEFNIDNQQDAAKRKLQQRKQEQNESTRNFLFELRVLYDEYRSPLRLTELRQCFEDGLNEECYYHYYWLTSATDKPETWEELKNLTTKIDNAPKRRPAVRENRPPPQGQPPEYLNSLNRRRDEAQPGGYHQRPNHQLAPRDRSHNYRGSGQSGRGQHHNPGNRDRGTRTTNNRPVCQICDKIGHLATVCWYRNGRHPNSQGRRN